MRLGLIAALCCAGLCGGVAYAQPLTQAPQPQASEQAPASVPVLGVAEPNADPVPGPAPSSSSGLVPPPPTFDSASRPLPAPAPALSLSLGASAWSGDYGADTTTDIAAVLLGVRYKVGPARLTASLPWMRIDSDGAIFTGVEGTPLVVVPGATPQKTVRDGLGDLTLGAAYLLTPDPDLGLDVDLSFKVKVPTASRSSGLSTRKADYAVGAEVSKAFGKLSPSISVSYRFFGDAYGIKFNDGVAASIGASYLISNRWVAVLSYDYAERTSQFIDDSHEIVGSFSTRLNDHGLRLTGFAAGGLSSGAAAVSGGLSLALGL